MTTGARWAITIAALLVAGIGAAIADDMRQKRNFEGLAQSDTKAAVVAKLGMPDLVQAAAPTEVERGCREVYFYRPNIRILDEEYMICFNGSGTVESTGYLVSQ